MRGRGGDAWPAGEPQPRGRRGQCSTQSRWRSPSPSSARAFYGFWLPDLPGPADDRIAPYALYFTDPFVAPVAKATHVPERGIALVALVVVAAVSVALGRLPALV